MHAAEPFPHFVDDYLNYLYEAHPTSATMDGVHLHDDLLEDFRRPALDALNSALAGFARRLDDIPVAPLPRTEQVEHGIVSANVRARQFELEETRSWERNPQVYADILASSLAAQAIFDYAPEADRARRILSKLRQTPRLIQAARDNVKEPPAIFIKVGIDTLRGVTTFIDRDLPRAFHSLDDLHLLADLADASTEAVQAVRSYIDYLENDVRPRAKASFRLGQDRFEQKLRLDEGISLPTDRLLAIAERELHSTQEEFRTLAGRLNGGDPIASWRKAKQEMHPEPGQLIDDRARAAGRAADLPAAQHHRLAAGGRQHRGRADAGVLPLVVCQHVDAGSVRDARVTRGLLPDRRRSVVAARSPARAPARLQHPDALEHLDPRGVPRALSALSAPAQDRVEGAALDAVRAGVVSRRLGALLRADDGRGRLRPARSHAQARTARRVARPARARRRRHPSAYR